MYFDSFIKSVFINWFSNLLRIFSLTVLYYLRQYLSRYVLRTIRKSRRLFMFDKHLITEGSQTSTHSDIP